MRASSESNFTLWCRRLPKIKIRRLKPALLFPLMFNPRGCSFFVSFSCRKSGQPCADFFAERLNLEPAMNFRETIEFHQPRLKQVSRSWKVRAGIVVERRGNLNQPLKELLVRIRRLEPHFFPMLVGVVKVGGIKCLQSHLVQPVLFV